MIMLSDQVTQNLLSQPNNTIALPLIGLGTWKLTGDFCTQIVKHALEIGYRHIDTATGYANHQAIGKAIETVDRDRIFITTKINRTDVTTYPSSRSIIEQICLDLNTEYIDLILLHNPDVPYSLVKDLAYELSSGVIRAIGVSNFNVAQLKEISKLFPHQIVVNQIELHAPIPFDCYKSYFKNESEQNQYYVMINERAAMREYCIDNNIIIVAHRPLAKGLLTDNKILKTIGDTYNKSAAQIALRWLIQQGFYVIPRGESLKQLQENIDVLNFSLTKEEMSLIANIT